ncbi:hypothetical protein [Photobacterium atrarenae]|uniref:Uncharacterized protein n=1 Tax=Photobacterium atrarenae TaxID=865757 RepID=A0ABY5GK59_9GAMM|nr:hypothetical protein [Photobacterium atrarenae]UTV29705.1 hypothetical protein NNL38_22100 [Photobacterium atrarenae]
MKHLYEQISKAINCQLPQINYADEVEKYRMITEDYRIKRVLEGWINQIKIWNPEFEGIFHGQEDIEVLIPAQADAEFLNF